MTASTKTIQNHSWLSRLIVALTIGLMTLALGASAAFAGTATQATRVAGHAAAVISPGGGGVSLNDDDDDDEDEDDEDEEGGGGGGGGLPATDTAALTPAGDATSPIPALALLVVAGLAGGAVTVAAKRSTRP